MLTLGCIMTSAYLPKVFFPTVAVTQIPTVRRAQRAVFAARGAPPSKRLASRGASEVARAPPSELRQGRRPRKILRFLRIIYPIVEALTGKKGTFLLDV